MILDEIEELKNQFVNQLTSVRIYLFGSYAAGSYIKEGESDKEKWRLTCMKREYKFLTDRQTDRI